VYMFLISFNAIKKRCLSHTHHMEIKNESMLHVSYRPSNTISRFTHEIEGCGGLKVREQCKLIFLLPYLCRILHLNFWISCCGKLFLEKNWHHAYINCYSKCRRCCSMALKNIKNFGTYVTIVFELKTGWLIILVFYKWNYFPCAISEIFECLRTQYPRAEFVMWYCKKVFAPSYQIMILWGKYTIKVKRVYMRVMTRTSWGQHVCGDAKVISRGIINKNLECFLHQKILGR
jgi:hypothetical protein